MVTRNTRLKLRQVLRDIYDDLQDDFTGEYTLKFNQGGLSDVQRKEKKEYKAEKNDEPRIDVQD